MSELYLLILLRGRPADEPDDDDEPGAHVIEDEIDHDLRDNPETEEGIADDPHDCPGPPAVD